MSDLSSYMVVVGGCTLDALYFWKVVIDKYALATGTRKLIY